MKFLTDLMNTKHPARNWKHRYKKFPNELLISFTVVYGLITGSFGALTSTPSNVAVLKGQEVAFNCSTNITDFLLWSILLPGATSEVLIFDGLHVNDRICFCSVKYSNQESTLYLPANESTAARYTCAEMNQDTKAIIQLIVLDSEPVCNDSSTDDIVSLKCIVNFSGHWSPVFVWMQIIGKEEKEITDQIETTRTLDQFRRIVTIVSILSVMKNKSAIAYRSLVKFSSLNKPEETTAENVPSYSFQWMWSSEEKGVSETTTADPGRQNRDGVIGSVVATVAAIALTTVVIVIIYAWKKKLAKPVSLVEVHVPLRAEGKEDTEA